MDLKKTMEETMTGLETRARSLGARAESSLRGASPAVDWKKVTPESLRAAFRDAAAVFAGHFRTVPVDEGSPSP